jgi:hypothetical protein
MISLNAGNIVVSAKVLDRNYTEQLCKRAN